MRHTIRLLFAAALGLACSFAAAQTYPPNTMRQLKTAWSEECSAEGAPKPLKMPRQGQLVGDLLGAAEEHDIEPLIHEAAGQSVVWCKEISTVKAVVNRLVTEAKQALEKKLLA